MLLFNNIIYIPHAVYSEPLSPKNGRELLGELDGLFLGVLLLLPAFLTDLVSLFSVPYFFFSFLGVPGVLVMSTTVSCGIQEEDDVEAGEEDREGDDDNDAEEGE